jgi:hypothetical protein
MQIDTGTSERTEAAVDHAHDMGRSIVDDRVFFLSQRTGTVARPVHGGLRLVAIPGSGPTGQVCHRYNSA